MRCSVILVSACLSLAGCGESKRSEANRLADARLFDEATVNAVLDSGAADIPDGGTDRNGVEADGSASNRAE